MRLLPPASSQGCRLLARLAIVARVPGNLSYIPRIPIGRGNHQHLGIAGMKQAGAEPPTCLEVGIAAWPFRVQAAGEFPIAVNMGIAEQGARCFAK